MISLDKVTVSFGGFELFKDISLLINKRDRLGLVGKNGAGKTTLLKLIKGLQSPDSGNITTPSSLTIGYLPQQLNIKDTQNLKDDVIASITEINQIQLEIDKIAHQVSHREDYETDSYLNLVDRLNDLNERFRILDGDKVEEKVERILLGLGFNPSDFNKPTSTFSGGWRMRIELAKVLLQAPDLLLLDEPTNHLDIESIQWLENFLSDYFGAVVLISHDRMFLDRITNRTIELTLGRCYDYPANYSKAMIIREERRELQKASFENQQKLIADTEDFIARFRYKATKAVQVQQRIKHLEKLDRIEVEEEDKSKINIRFPAAPRSGTIVIETEGLVKDYDRRILSDIDLIIERHEKVAFVGRNGEGKTTLAKIIVGETTHSGILKYGHNVKIGYFAQNQDEILDLEKTVFQTIDDIAVGDIRTRIRDLLGSFLFRGEDIDKKVKVLSGGERSRLAIAKLLLEPYNLLILDEPTNHLDMRSKDMLKDALLKYDGTLILVSHDRDFLEGLTDRILEFRDQKIKEFRGSISQFLEKKRMASFKELEKKALDSQKSEKDSSSNKIAWEERKKIDSEIRKREKQIEEIEIEINLSETKIQEWDLLLSDPEKGKDFISDENFYQRYNEEKKVVEKQMKNWENIQYEIEILKDKRNM